MLAGLLLPAAWLTASAQTVASLADLSLEQLSNIVVTSVSGRPQRLRDAASSIYVITAEDIRRSAATSLPEALRLAPNLQVARLNSGQYAISARGFNNPLANKLLVLIDGRTIYSTLFAGVFWDFHDLLLEDIDRIEVISGPGGTLWGANAVNGIINIVTRPAFATQGALLSVQRSHGDGGREAARWGGSLPDGHFRVYALASDRNNTHLASGAERPDASSREQAGFRADWRAGAGQLTLQGDAFHGGDLPSTNLAPRLRGGNLLARYEGRFADASPYRVQLSYDVLARDETNAFRNESRATELQFTHEPRPFGRHQLLWGAGHRSARDRNDPSPLVAFFPPTRTLDWSNVFVQDQVAVTANDELTLGVKAEHNSYTGLEWLPSVRLAHAHPGGSSTWAALSRAVRAPSRIDRDFFFPGQAPFLIQGGPEFQSETANVLELGHRGSLGRDLSYDLTVFRQQYRGLRAGSNALPPTIENRIDGSVSGVEAWGTWDVNPGWRLSAGYRYLRERFRFSSPAPAPRVASGIAGLGNDPRHEWSLRSRLDVSANVDFDVFLRRVGALPAPAVPAYTALDARIGWRLRPGLELSLLAQNLGGGPHAEYNAPATASVLDRRLFLKLVWQP